MELLVLAALLASPGRAPAEPLPRGSRVLVLNAALAPAALEEVAAARGWKVDSAPAATQAIVAAKAGKPKLLVVSAGLVDAPRLASLRGAAPGAKLILTRAAGESRRRYAASGRSSRSRPTPTTRPALPRNQPLREGDAAHDR